MKLDIILSGVGGQGILSIATVIGEAATAAGLNLKQAEVHGMSQRGGGVHSDLRLSTDDVHSDIIPRGAADLIIAMEPMEALRYLPFLSAEGWIVTSSQPFVNIPNYPDINSIRAELAAHGRCISLDTESLARDGGTPMSSNMVLLGIAAPLLKILTPEQLRSAIERVFAAKGEQVVASNVKAFDWGTAHSNSISNSIGR